MMASTYYIDVTQTEGSTPYRLVSDDRPEVIAAIVEALLTAKRHRPAIITVGSMLIERSSNAEAA